MATRTNKSKASFLNNGIDVLDSNTVEPSPVQKIFKTVRAILALVRVSALVLLPPIDSYRWPNQGKMANDEVALKLSEHCFDACEVLNTAGLGENADVLSESVKVALEDLERYVG